MIKLLYKSIYKSKGFSLLEAIVMFVLSAILITTVASAYVQYLKTNQRQQRTIQVERELFAVKDAVSQALTTLPGRGLATTNGLASATPILPAAGSLQDTGGKITPIKLGIVTPYKINGQDAFTVAYADAKTPRLAISQSTTVSGNIGSAKVSLIATQSNFMITKGTGTSGSSSSTSGPSDTSGSSGSGSSTGGGKTITSSSSNDFSQSQVKGGGSSPSPSPSPTPSSSPTPTETATPSPTSTPVPPNIALETTLLDLPWKPSADMFRAGDVLLLINTPKDLGQTEQVQTSSRLVKITSVTGTNNSKGELQAIDFTFDLCLTGECGGIFPGLVNPSDAETKFDAGAILVPLKLATFYFKSDKQGNKLIRNRGGVVLLDNNGNFRIQGGEETTLGETDSFTVTYRLRDGSTKPTPNAPLVDWLGNVVSIDVEMFREIPTAQGKAISRQAKLNFPIAIRNLD